MEWRGGELVEVNRFPRAKKIALCRALFFFPRGEGSEGETGFGRSAQSREAERGLRAPGLLTLGMGGRGGPGAQESPTCVEEGAGIMEEGRWMGIPMRKRGREREEEKRKSRK